MGKDTVVRYKLHFVWQDEKEERWLRDMARDGLHMVKAYPWCRYVFRRGAPADVAYRLDYAPPSGASQHYRQLFQDAGWEHALSCMHWEYWRKPVAADGRDPEIFTDGASKADKLRRVRTMLVAVALPSLTVIWANPAYWRLSQTMSMGSRVGVAAIAVVLLGLYAWGFARISQRIRALNRSA
jgi:hypothetical protein